MTERAVRFVLLSHHHCGETALRGCLAGHPGLKMYGELFHPSEDCRQDNAGPGRAPYKIGEDGAAYLDRRAFRLRANGAAQAIGFAMTYDDARIDRFMATAWDYLIQNRDIRILHLTRRNPLDAYLAAEAADRVPGWLDPFDPGATYQVEPFSVTSNSCHEALDRLITRQLWARQAFAGHPLIELEYQQDIVGDFCAAMSRICQFLGVDPADPRFGISPPTPRREGAAAELLINFAELGEHFRYSLYERLFPTTTADA